MQVVRIFGNDIHMEFGLDKGKKTALKTGQLVHSHNLILNFSREIQEFEKEKHTFT